jgi:DeoR/GlpR family transcriptional regulator of sugar metabolism
MRLQQNLNILPPPAENPPAPQQTRRSGMTMEMTRRARKKSDRHKRILDTLRANAALRISDLARELNVSGETIRRDLAELGEAGIVNRTYGGAVAKPFSLEPDWTDRHGQMRDERALIADLAMKLVQPGDVLMLECGSTVLHFATKLAADGKDLTVITPSLSVAATLSQNASVTVVMCPGTIYARENMVIGAETVAYLQQFHASTAFFGATGITEAGLNETHPGITAIKRAMMARARKRVALVDHGKFDHSSLALVCPLRDVNVVVSDRAPGGSLAGALRQAGVELITPTT